MLRRRLLSASARVRLLFRKHRHDASAVLTDKRLDAYGSSRPAGVGPGDFWACGEFLIATDRTLSWEELATGTAVASCRYLGHADKLTDEPRAAA